MFNLDIITYLTPVKRAMGAVKLYEQTIKPLEANEFYKDPQARKRIDGDGPYSKRVKKGLAT